MPEATPLPFQGINMSFVFVGDDALALKLYMMKPYPQRELTPDKRVYDYYHSRARRISENVFGIIANRWRVFRSILNVTRKGKLNYNDCSYFAHFSEKTTSRDVYSPPGLVDREKENVEVTGARKGDPAASLELEQLSHDNYYYCYD